MFNQIENHINTVKEKFFLELWNERNFVSADDIFTNDFITESIALESSNWTSIHGKGPESMKHHVKWWLDIIPDAKMKVLDIAASNDKVISSWELRGTMKKAVFGINPTNREIIIFGCTVSIFQGDKISLNKTLFDRLGFLQQIDLLPASSELFKSE
ncbi:MAG: ester cyclase [Chitinophagales bacterium]